MVQLKVKQRPPFHITSEDQTMPFGKHKDITIADILHDEPGYFDWLREKKLITTSKEMGEVIDNRILEWMDDKEEEVDQFNWNGFDWNDINEEPY